MRLAILVCFLALASPAQTVLRSGTFRAVNSAPGGGSPNDGYEANLWAYFKCEEADGIAVDSVSGSNLSSVSGTPANMTGIIGQAFDMGGDGFGWDTQGALDNHYEFSGHDFTMRAWIKIEDRTGLILTRGGNSDGFSLVYSFGIHFKIVESDGLHSDEVISPDLSHDVWHRVIVWHKTGVEIGVQIDADPSTTASVSAGMESLDGEPLKLPIGFKGGLDEIAIWKDYVLTDDDKTFDFNGGAGRTYLLP